MIPLRAEAAVRMGLTMVKVSRKGKYKIRRLWRGFKSLL